ncbi:unnamed protein product, partial [Ranitomeya imitator]
ILLYLPQNNSRDQGPDAAKDLQRDRGAYSQNDTTSTLTPNLDFYQNKKPFKPNGVHIDELLSMWKHDYDRLERNHSYIQWLFPLRKPGQNPSAKPLTTNEIQVAGLILTQESDDEKDSEVNKRFLRGIKSHAGKFYASNIEQQNWRGDKSRQLERRFEKLEHIFFSQFYYAFL